MARPRIKVPKTIVAGEPFEVKTLVSHTMESGLRKDETTGEVIPRKILNSFVCRLDGNEVFRAKFHPAVSANPYLSFFVAADADGELEFVWVDDDGTEVGATKKIKVTAP